MSYEYLDLLCMGCFTRLETSGGYCPYCGFNEGLYEVTPYQLPLRTILGGKYMIGKVLGEGGFGITYIGYDLNLDVKVAVKEFYPSDLVTRSNTMSTTVQPYSGERSEYFAKGRDRFVDEAKRLARFRVLPGIVMVNDFLAENGTAYIVMEYVEGQTLKDYVAQAGGKLPPGQVIELMSPVFGSLAQIHESGIIHRDISPDNVMITHDGSVKLLDFGAAREFGEDGNKSLSVMLKHGYAPAEQYSTRGEQGAHTDVYALSATIYKAITGVTPENAMDRILDDRLEPPGKLGVAMQGEQESALMKGLAIRQEDRYKSAAELYSALRADVPYSPSPVIASAQSNPDPTLPEPQRPEPTAPQQSPDSPVIASARSNPDPTSSVTTPSKKSNRNKIIAAIIAACVVLTVILVLVIPFGGNNADNLRGNTVGNLSNWGWAATDGDKIYYTNYMAYHGENIYSVNFDGSDNTQLGNGSFLYLNVLDGWIYCTGYFFDDGEHGEEGIYKMRTDGSDVSRISNDYAYMLTVIGNKIYYLHWDDEEEVGRLISMDTDGKNRQQLTEDGVSFIDISGNQIFYINVDDTDSDDFFENVGKIYVIGTDGNNRRKISDDHVEIFNVAGDRIYYTNLGDEAYWMIYSIKTDGSDKQHVSDNAAYKINISGDRIYYIEPGRLGIHSIRLDGSDDQRLSDVVAWSINVVGDRIFFTTRDGFFTMLTDGSEHMSLEDFIGGAGSQPADANDADMTPPPEPIQNVIVTGTRLPDEVSDWSDIVDVALSAYCMAGLKSDGTVVAESLPGGDDGYSAAISEWQDIIKITAGTTHIVGLKSDGTVIGNVFNYAEEIIPGWQDIIDIAAGYIFTVGLKSDGTVMVTGYDRDWFEEVSKWRDIVTVAAGRWHTAGLKSDGTVLTFGSSGEREIIHDVSEWRDIVAIDAGNYHTVGLKSDGTVVAAGSNANSGQLDVSGWRDIVAIAAGDNFTVGLKSDGTVVAVGLNTTHGQIDEVSGWRDIVAIFAGEYNIVGLTGDVSTLSVGGAGGQTHASTPSAPDTSAAAEEIDTTNLIGFWETDWLDSGDVVFMNVAFGMFGEIYLLVEWEYSGMVVNEVEGTYSISGNKIVVTGTDYIYETPFNHTFTFRFDGDKLVFGIEGTPQRTFTKGEPDYPLPVDWW